MTHSIEEEESVSESEEGEIEEKVPLTIAHLQWSLSSPPDVLKEGNSIVEKLSPCVSVEQSACSQPRQVQVASPQLERKDHLPLGDQVTAKVQTGMKEGI